MIANLNEFTNLLNLAAVVIPLRQTDLGEKLKAGCQYLPMPLSLGWEHGYWLEDPAQRKDDVPGLLLSDIKSGATRQVRAPWMHTLYSDSLMKHRFGGATLLHLSEASYSTKVAWPHLVIYTTLAAQLCLAFWSITKPFHPLQGWLILAGLFVRLLQALCSHAFPDWDGPRSGNPDRYFALHTGMTTRHILVVAHRGPDGQACQLEDCAAPRRRVVVSREKMFVEYGFKGTVQLLAWVHKAACVVTNSSGLILTSALALGMIVTEGLYLVVDCLPAPTRGNSNPREITPGRTSVLDMLTAVCQETSSASCGFIEAILPDPTGEHRDYRWIDGVVKDIFHAGRHPSHPDKEKVLQLALRRRTRSSAPSQPPSPVP